MWKNRLLNSALFASDFFFFRFLRHLTYMFFRNKIRGKVKTNSFLKHCKIISSKDNSVTFGRGGVYKDVFVRIDGKNNHVSFGQAAVVNEGLSITVLGDNNRIVIDEKCYLYSQRSSITVKGNNCAVVIGKHISAKKMKMVCYDDGSSITIGDFFDAADHVSLISMEGKKVTIDDNVLCSYGVEIRNSDSHSIFDLNGTRLNNAKNVEIGSDVWIAQGALILKGASIPRGTIIGARALVNKPFNEEMSIIVGSPAVCIKKGVTWQKERVAVVKNEK